MHACLFVPATDCTCVCIGCTPQLHSCRPCAIYRACSPVVFTGRWLRSHVNATVTTLLCQTLLNKDRQCWDAELRVRAMCDVTDTTGEDLVPVRWVILLCSTAMSCLTNNTLTASSSSSDCYDDWHQASPTARHPSYNACSMFSRCRLLH